MVVTSNQQSSTTITAGFPVGAKTSNNSPLTEEINTLNKMSSTLSQVRLGPLNQPLIDAHQEALESLRDRLANGPYTIEKAHRSQVYTALLLASVTPTVKEGTASSVLKTISNDKEKLKSPYAFILFFVNAALSLPQKMLRLEKSF